MKTIRNILAALGLAALVGLSGYAIFGKSPSSYNSVLDPARVPAFATSNTINPAGDSAGPIDFEKAAEEAVPSVVHIKTVTKFKQTNQQRQFRQQDPFGGFFGNMDPFGGFFGNGQNFQRPEERASGSGVIISDDGYIVTNNHVIDGATEISVTLSNGKNFKAKVVGADPNTDLALIKIDGKNLPVMPIGNSDDVKLGQWVLAIGYPLNLDVTVTQGIVSAKSRNIGINMKGNAPIEAFIQTDAAVNPGSSGGALVNTDGQLVGINAAIASPTGAFSGYAYSIPSNLMKKVIGDIMKYGSVRRGYLGISMAPENPDSAMIKNLGINTNISGVWVAETDPKGAAAEAGIKKGDVITKIDGAPVTRGSQLAERIAVLKPGDKVAVTVERAGKEKTFNVTLKDSLGTMPSELAAEVNSLGAQLQTLSKSQAAKLKIDGGVRVSKINEDGILANQTNMRDGFVITRIGNQKVSSVDELKNALNKQGNNFQIEGVYPGSSDIYYYGINGFRN